MDLTIYDIIVRPVLSSKSMSLVRRLKKLEYEVHMHANKPMIKDAFKKLFGIDLLSVRTIIRAGKQRRARRLITTDAARKYAIITLKDEKAFDTLMQTGGSMPSASAPSVQPDVQS